MGLYDYRCLLTGISLQGANCVAIVLQRGDDGWQPASLPVRGFYGGYGTLHGGYIDGERSDIASHVATSFAEDLKDNVTTLEGDADWAWRNSESSLFGRMLEVVERTATGHGTVLFDGQSVAHTLIQTPVFDAISAQFSTETNEPTRELLQRVLPTPLGRRWYGDIAGFSRCEIQAELRRGLLQIAAIAVWMRENGCTWSTPRVFTEPGEQHSLGTIIESFRAARSRFADVGWLRAPLEEIGTRIKHRGEPDGWINHIDVSWYAIASGTTRIACTHFEQIEPRINDEFFDPTTLVGQTVELIAIDRGDIAACIDIRPYLRLRSRNNSATLDDIAACQKLLDTDDDIAIELAPLAVPKLRQPLAVARDPVLHEVLFIVPEPPPAWLTEEEGFQAVIPFELEK